MEKWFPNGVNTQYTYNQDNTLKQLINRHGSGSIMSQHDYSYDPFGNRSAHTEVITGLSTKAFSYTYDELNRLKEVRDNGSLVESYSFSAIHNRLTRTAGANTFNYTYDTANPNSDSRLTEIRNGSGTLLTGMVYDQNGNLVRKCEGGTVTVSPTTCSGSTVSDMVYDAFNRMTVLVKAGAGHTYAYDPQGRRVQKIVAGIVTNYVYDGTQIVNHYDSNWAQPNFRYTYGPGADAPTIQGSATSAQYYHQNGIGNVVAVTNASGVAAGTASYDAYGNVTASTGTLPTYGFTGREPDETAMIYFRARYYDPAIGRFIQRDPIGLDGGLNVYAYVNNNPVDAVDPTGLVDIIYSPGPLGRSNPIIANPQTPGNNYLVAGPHGETVPMGVGVYQRTVVQGRPFDRVFDASRTSAIIAWGREHIVNNRTSGASGTPSLAEIFIQSLPRQPWDTKQFLPATSNYIVNGKAELRDYVGNVIWGTGLNALGVEQNTALRGASVQGWLASPVNGEDARDQEAIRFGFTLLSHPIVVEVVKVV